MTGELTPTATEVRRRLAQRITPEGVRSGRIEIVVSAALLALLVHRLFMDLFEMARLTALLAAAVCALVLNSYQWSRLRVRGPEDFTQSEVNNAAEEVRECKSCGNSVFLFEGACPSCGSKRHQFSVRAEFLPFAAIVVVTLVLALLVR